MSIGAHVGLVNAAMSTGAHPPPPATLLSPKNANPAVPAGGFKFANTSSAVEPAGQLVKFPAAST